MNLYQIPQFKLDIVAIRIDLRMKKWENHESLLNALYMSSFQIFYVICRSRVLTFRFRLCSLFVSDLAMKNSASMNSNKDDLRSRSAENMWSNRWYFDFISLRFRSRFWCALFNCFWRYEWIVRVIDDEAFVINRLSFI